ncbi:MAG TPA: PAS domain S-box protein [Spirochaetes bacterium]|nr:PAS domain S-box protein [Spirochaetota bacterium]
MKLIDLVITKVWGYTDQSIDMNIQNKILIGIISLLIFSIGLIGYFFYQSTNALHSKIVDNLKRSSEEHRDKLDTSLIHYQKAVSTLSATISLVQDIDFLLAKEKKLYPGFKQLIYTDLKGQVLFHYPHTEKIFDIDYPKESFWNKAMNTHEVTISQINKNFAYPFIVVSAPVFKDPRNNSLYSLEGIINVIIPLKSIFKPFSLIKIGKHGSIFVLDKDGWFLHHQNAQYIMNKKLSHLGDRKALKKIESSITHLGIGRVGWETYQSKGETYFISFTQTRIGSWSLCVTGLLKDFTHDVDSLTQGILITLSLSIIISIIIIYVLITRFVSRPVYLIKKAMKEVRDGKLGKQVVLKNKDEIGDLATAFNYMSESLLNTHTALRESEDRFRLLSETAPEGIILHERGIILDGNSTLETMFGYPLSELIGKSVLDITDSLSHDIVKNNINSEEDRIYEAIGLRKDGSRYTIEVSSRGAIYHGRKIRIASIRDASERKEIEQLRESVERIARHDLKNPLNAIIGFSNILSKQELTPKQHKFLASILENGHTMLYMIDHSLDLFKMEQGIYKFKPIEVNLVRLFKKLNEEFFSFKKEGLIQLVYYLNGQSISWDANCTISGEPGHLERLFANLIKNALEASSNGEQVTVSINKVDYEYRSVVEIIIHNTGVIPEEIRERFFDRYITLGKAGGTGLGTYSAYLITKTHGGDISFSTSKKQGTRLKILLPTTQENYDINNIYLTGNP